MKNREGKRRILDISYRRGLSHIGSCLTAYDIIYHIYRHKEVEEPFVLSAGHAALALYVVLEEFEGKNAEELFERHGVHPNRNLKDGIFASTGSLGHGIGIAVGLAKSDEDRNVYVLLSDGECAEGSVWESLRIAGALSLTNLHVYVNINGWGAYHAVGVDKLFERLSLEGYPAFTIHRTPTNMDEFAFIPGLKDQSAHYYTLTEADYELIKQKL